MEDEAPKINEGVAEWEVGLPSADDITPLSQSLIPAELASAFKISQETPRTLVDVNRASQNTFSLLLSASNFKPLAGIVDDHVMADVDEGGSDPKRSRRMDDESGIENSVDEQSTAAAKKRPRLVWTPQLHKRFVEVVAHLGLKNAVPKTIMQLMNVEGLTRENVASHLQKYRLYVKRMQGLSDEGPSPSDHLFASAPLPLPQQSFNEPSSSEGHGNRSHNNLSGGGNGSNKHAGMQIPMPYFPPPPIMQMPMAGMAGGSANSSVGFNGYEAGNSHHHYHHHHRHYQQQQYSNMMQQKMDWSGNKFNNTYSHHVTHNTE